MRFIRTLALIAVLTGSLVACGASSSTPDSKAQATATSAPTLPSTPDIGSIEIIPPGGAPINPVIPCEVMGGTLSIPEGNTVNIPANDSDRQMVYYLLMKKNDANQYLVKPAVVMPGTPSFPYMVPEGYTVVNITKGDDCLKESFVLRDLIPQDVEKVELEEPIIITVSPDGSPEIQA